MVMVSIGMPVYNGDEYLESALFSLLNQTYMNFELIISDNCSNDNTESICNKFVKIDSRIKYIRQYKNIGQLNNFNFVKAAASGEYFLWAAHDDLWDKEWISSLLKNFKDGTAISFGAVVNIDHKGKIFKTYPKLNYLGPKLLRLINFYLAEDTWGKPNIIYGLFRSELIKNISFTKQGENDYGQDMMFIFSFLDFGSIEIDDTVRIYKRVNYYKSKKTILGVLKSIFLLERIEGYLIYYKITSDYKFKTLFILLFPIKYIMSVVYYLFSKLLKICAKK